MKQYAVIFSIIFLFSGNLLAENSKAATEKQELGSSALSNMATTFLQANPDIEEPSVIPGKIVVKLQDNLTPLAYSVNKSTGQVVTQYASVNDKIAANGISEIKKVFPAKEADFKNSGTDLSKIYYFSFDKNRKAEEVAAEFAGDENIIYAEALSIHQIHETVPNDPMYPQQYHFGSVHAELAWDVTWGSAAVIVGIVDSGVDLDHPDLAANLWVNEAELNGTAGVDDDGNGFIDDINGWDFVGASTSDITPDNNPTQKDGSGHGTHVSGIVGAVADNSIGVAGMAWNVSLMVTKHSPDDYSNSIYYGYDGIVYCVDSGADIVNLSWGGSSSSSYGRDIINYAHENGVLVVAAAGNDVDGGTYAPPEIVPPHYPSAYENVLSIAASKYADEIESYSYYGSTVDLAAPGTILSTVPVSHGSYDTKKGTSMASPLVAGVAALVKSVHPGWTNEQLASQVKYTTDNIDLIGINNEYLAAGGYGTGRVNAHSAVSMSPGIIFKFKDMIFNDSTFGDGDGIIENGETISLKLELANNWSEVENVVVSFATTDNAISVTNNTIDFGNLPGGSTTLSADAITFTVSEDALPHMVSFQLTISTTSGADQVFDKTFSVEPLVLVVGDYVGIDVSSYYLEALDKLGIVYDYIDKQFEPLNEGELNSYPIVIWSCEWAFPSLDTTDRRMIKTYLDNGGNLFLSGQDIGWDLADPASNINEYHKSAGESGTFYNTYLKADYINDIAVSSSLSGVADDPIAADLQFNVFQPFRTSAQQYPDEISPVNGSVSIFDYDGGASGAIRFSDVYRLVYFSFGGYEAITDEASRATVMPKIINWLSDLSIDYTALTDTEDELNDYLVEAAISTEYGTITTAELFWDTDGEMPFNRIEMTEDSAGFYSAMIPQQSETDVEYFVFGRTAEGFYTPYKIRQFHVGSDIVLPQLEVLTQPSLSVISKTGPYHFILAATDNIGIDPNSCYLHWFDNTVRDSVKFGNLQGDNFEGALTFSETREKNDLINYYFSIKDTSSNRNTAFSDTFGFVIDTTELLDDFEKNTLKWDVGDGWALASNQKKSGEFSITDSPGSDYPNNANNILTYQHNLDLSEFKDGWLSLYMRPVMEWSGDTCFVELSNDNGLSWNAAGSVSGQRFYMAPYKFYITDFCGEGNSEVMLRFRVATDSADVKDGVYIDDVSVHGTSVPAVGIGNESITEVPHSYFLKQNYPNPFNPSTIIEFGIKNNSKVELTVYSLLGQKIKTLVRNKLNTGVYSYTWNGTDNQNRRVASGLYIYRLSISEPSGLRKDFTSKMLLIK